MRIRAMGQTFVVPNHHPTPSKATTKPNKELTPISEDGSCPASQYQDIISKLGILSLPLQMSAANRRSICQIDSPDLISASTSLAPSELTSPTDEFNPSIDPPKDLPNDPLPVDMPSVDGKWHPALPHATSASV